MSSDADQSGETKFGPNGFEIRATKNRLATRKFPQAEANRQAPFSVSIPGPNTLRNRKTPYKSET